MRTGFRAATLSACLTGAVLALPGAPSFAQTAQDTYPSRPITLVVGYAAGGATDIVGRLIAKSLSEQLNQTVVVENRSGANSNIGAEHVARAANDGYTLFVSSIANTINRSLYTDLSHDYLADFEPIGLMASIANVLVVNPRLPIKSVDDYIRYAKDRPGQLTCASSGVGSSINMSCELFKLQTGTDILHVPYRGSGPAVADLLGGQVDSMFDNLPSSLPHIQAGKLRALATTMDERVESLPDVPTFAEGNLKDFVVQSWFGLSAPKDTPQAVIARLNDALNKSLQSAEVVQAYRSNGYIAPTPPNSPDTFGAFGKAEVDRWEKVVRNANLKAN